MTHENEEPTTDDGMLDDWEREWEEEMAQEDAERRLSYARDPIQPEQRTLAGNHPVDGLSGLVGGRIINVGFHPQAEEGGMAIEYEKDGEAFRTVFGYTELGLWVEWQGKIERPS